MYHAATGRQHSMSGMRAPPHCLRRKSISPARAWSLMMILEKTKILEVRVPLNLNPLQHQYKILHCPVSRVASRPRATFLESITAEQPKVATGTAPWRINAQRRSSSKQNTEDNSHRHWPSLTPSHVAAYKNCLPRASTILHNQLKLTPASQ